MAMTSHDSIIHLQKTIGNQAVQRLLRSNARDDTKRTGIQRKLKVGQPGDVYEKEADRIAEQVMRMSDPGHIDLTASREEERIDRKCSTCEMKKRKEEEEELKISRKASTMFDSETSEEATTKIKNVLSSGGSSLENDTKDLMESRFSHDLSGVRIHKDERAAESAQSVNALAYSVKQDIVFGPGQYAPKTKEGQRLLAHELVHTIKSGSSAPEGLIQRRRVPAGPGLETALPTTGAGFIAGRTGLARILSRAWAGLDSPQRAAVWAHRGTKMKVCDIPWTPGFSFKNPADVRASEEDLLTALNSPTTTREQLLCFAQVIRKVKPGAELGDPLKIEASPRLGTDDAVNIHKIVSNANSIFAKIASGLWDVHIGQVFGGANKDRAKTKYAKARYWMNHLESIDKIIADRSGFSAETSTAALTLFHEHIALESKIIDEQAGDVGSAITLIHESMHAGNEEVKDKGYIGDAGQFTAETPGKKLNNAAHYEVVPCRIHSISNCEFKDQTFIPAGTTGSGGTARQKTRYEKVIDGAGDIYRNAWIAAINLHKFFVRVFLNPTEWNVNFGGGIRFSNTLPFWSKVEMLTIHTRLSSINPAGPPEVRPVTLIDVSLSEGLTRKMAQGGDEVPRKDLELMLFELSYAKVGSDELARTNASVNEEVDVLIRLVIRAKLGRITGDENRDVRVVKRLAKWGPTDNLIADILTVRSPGAFP